MNTDRLVSVIVATHDHERFVEEALRSLMAQTHSPLELILLDDGSTDATFERVQTLLPELRERFVRVDAATQTHEGASRTISKCLEVAQGELVFLLDSDDVALPSAIDDLLPYMDAPDVALAVGDNQYIDARGLDCSLEKDGEALSTLLAFHTKGRARFSQERDFGAYSSLIEGNYIPNGWLLRRRCVDDVGGYAHEAILDDWPLLLRLAKKYRIAYAGKVLAKYRVHEGNTNRVHAEGLFLDTARTLLREREYCVANGLDREWWDHASRFFRAATPEQLERIGFLPALLPEIDSERLALLQTLSAARTGGGHGIEPESPSAAALISTPAPPPPGSLGQRIHLYALCWNDARMLPFFFRHYDPWVQRYVIFDDNSTDGSLELLRAHPRVDIRRFVRTDPESFVLSELAHYDQCWKASRGEADWIFLCDVDEHLFHPDLPAYLGRCLAQGVTAVPAIGYEMVSDAFPEAHERLCVSRTRGIHAADMSKLSVFSPGALQETGFAPGGHSACPMGRIVAPPRDELRLLHYKMLGLDYAATRHAALASRLRPRDLEQDWGHQWTARADELAGVFEDWRARCVDLSLETDAVIADPSSVWWRQFSRAKDWEELARAALDRDRLLAALEASESDRLQTSQHLGAATARVSALESSKTWRWTRAIRGAIDAVRGLKKRSAFSGSREARRNAR